LAERLSDEFDSTIIRSELFVAGTRTTQVEAPSAQVMTASEWSPLGERSDTTVIERVSRIEVSIADISENLERSFAGLSARNEARVLDCNRLWDGLSKRQHEFCVDHGSVLERVGKIEHSYAELFRRSDAWVFQNEALSVLTRRVSALEGKLNGRDSGRPICYDELDAHGGRCHNSDDSPRSCWTGTLGASVV